MTDTRRAFAYAILDALRESNGEHDTPFINRSPLTLACIEGRVNMLAAVDAILAEFLVVPRSEVHLEYGVHHGGFVHGDVRSAEAARRRAVHVFETAPDAARRREVWTGPWRPLDENGDRDA